MLQDANGNFIMSRIELIKMIREKTSDGLKESKDWLDAYLLGQSCPEFARALDTVVGLVDRSVLHQEMRKAICVKFNLEEKKQDW